jgi:hypothetical protein
MLYTGSYRGATWYIVPNTPRFAKLFAERNLSNCIEHCREIFGVTPGERCDRNE